MQHDGAVGATEDLRSSSFMFRDPSESSWRWHQKYGELVSRSWYAVWITATEHPDYTEWRALATRRGQDPDDTDFSYYMTRSLLIELLHAAAGVRHAELRIQEAMERAQTEFLSAARCIPASDDPKAPDHKQYTSSPAVWAASFALTDLLSWVRSVGDRVYRTFRGVDRGLLPSLRPGDLHDAVHRAYEEFVTGIQAYRHLSNYALHAGSIPGGGTPAAEVVDGQARFLMPDPPARTVLTWDEFDFDQRHHAVEIAAALRAATERLVDGILVAFDAHLPA